MCFACKSDVRCDHSLNDCATVKGEYCLVCHHNSSLPAPARRSTALGPRKDRRSLSELLREIRLRRAGTDLRPE
jgi:hypothetical protein